MEVFDEKETDNQSFDLFTCSAFYHCQQLSGNGCRKKDFAQGSDLFCHLFAGVGHHYAMGG
jgi:hypothetical protein